MRDIHANLACVRSNKISEKRNAQTDETTPFGFGSLDAQPKSPIAVRPASPFFGYLPIFPSVHQAIDLGAHGPGRLWNSLYPPTPTPTPPARPPDRDGARGEAKRGQAG